MEKVITISGRDVRFKSTASLPLRYKAQFGRDLFADLDRKKDDPIDSEAFYNMIWTLAKIADDSIPPLLEWVDTFESFPVFEIFNKVGDLVTKTMRTTEKNAQPAVSE